MESNSSVAAASTVTSGQRLNFNLHLLSVTLSLEFEDGDGDASVGGVAPADVGRVSALTMKGEDAGVKAMFFGCSESVRKGRFCRKQL